MTMSTLKYDLFLNELTRDDPDDYVGRLLDVPTFTQDDLIAIITREGTTFTEEEARGVLSALEKAAVELSQRGNITTPLFSTTLSMKGVFHSNDEPFTPGKHRIGVKLQAGSSLDTAGQQVRVERVITEGQKPILVHLTDMDSGQKTDTLVADHIVQIKGKTMKILLDDTRQGVFLIDESKAETALVVLDNKPGKLLVRLPKTLKKGSYRLEVRQAPKADRDLRIGTYKRVVTVG